MDVLMLPGYFGQFTNLVTMDLPATNLITREALGWEPAGPGLFADLDNGHYFRPADGLSTPTKYSGVTMTTFAPHRDTLESFVDCINGGADKDTLTGLLAKDVRAARPVQR